MSGVCDKKNDFQIEENMLKSYKGELDAGCVVIIFC